ncbi:MAG: helix-turn-helix domain-containing protein [Zoogloeaceae bacterium]|jgi:transcriptional regulator with XRE-family HTH domain|nr:helix-turn-helix domain-containing protein [Zoogloeaceae bacterium]
MALKTKQVNDTNGTEKKSIGARIRQERERLGISQRQFGPMCGASRTTQRAYEHDETTPKSDYLDRAEALGCDKHYILTGLRDARALPKTQREVLESSSPEHLALLKAYNDAPDILKRAALAVLGVAGKPPADSGRGRKNSARA